MLGFMTNIISWSRDFGKSYLYVTSLSEKPVLVIFSYDFLGSLPKGLDLTWPGRKNERARRTRHKVWSIATGEAA